MGKKALGRGLDALFEETGEDIHGESIPNISIDSIVPAKHQPRKTFHDEKIQELAHSIRENGLLQPVILVQRGEKYELIVGERRLRAARIAGLEELPAIIKDYSEEKALEIALIENIQREDLNPIEESRAYKMIIEREMITQEELSNRVGKSRSYIANMIRLLELPQKVQEHVSRGTISVGQAKAVLSLPDKGGREAMVRQILDQNLTVREVEKLTRKRDVPRGTKRGYREPFVEEIEERLRSKLGTKVSVNYREGKGWVRIEFYSGEELERIIDEITS
jgi:ParB family chromosome partitioning protein